MVWAAAPWADKPWAWAPTAGAPATTKPWHYYAQQRIGASMPGYLKQATAAQARTIGPFIDDTDFKTAETGLTIANTDIKLIVNGAASANKNSGGGTHRANGVYGVTFDATDTATVGEMEVSVVVAGALPVFDKFFVLEEAVYDALFAASAPGYGTAQTGDSFARLGAPAGASVSADVAAVKAETALIVADTNELQTDWVNGGRLDLILDALATQASVDTVDTVVDAIKAKTDSLNFTVAGQVDSNVQYVNDAAVTGNGQTGTEWGPA